MAFGDLFGKRLDDDEDGSGASRRVKRAVYRVFRLQASRPKKSLLNSLLPCDDRNDGRAPGSCRRKAGRFAIATGSCRCEWAGFSIALGSCRRKRQVFVDRDRFAPARMAGLS